MQCPVTMCCRLSMMLEMLNMQDRSFGMITKLMVLRANGEVLRIYHASRRMPAPRAYSRKRGMCASAARVRAQEQCARHHAQARDVARARRAAPALDSRACQPSPRVRPGQKSKAGDPKTVTRAKPGPPGRGPGRPGARGAGRLLAPPSAPANPGSRTTLV